VSLRPPIHVQRVLVRVRVCFVVGGHQSRVFWLMSCGAVGYGSCGFQFWAAVVFCDVSFTSELGLDSEKLAKSADPLHFFIDA
jgi:hypothetical protein